jgi:hypothetical protein
MNAETQKVDVVAAMRKAVGRLRVQHPDHETDAANDAAARALHESIDAAAELISMMGEVLHLWDTDRMSIDAKAAALQDRPEKWRAALARVGGAE